MSPMDLCRVCKCLPLPLPSAGLDQVAAVCVLIAITGQGLPGGGSALAVCVLVPGARARVFLQGRTAQEGKTEVRNSHKHCAHTALALQCSHEVLTHSLRLAAVGCKSS